MFGKMIPEASKPSNGDDGSYQNTIKIDKEISDSKFDETDYFNKEIRPVLEKLVQLCSNREIPVMVELSHSNTDKDGRGVCFLGVLPGARTPMSFRLIADMMNDKTGFSVKACAIALAAFHHAEKENHNNKENNENE